MNTRVMPTLLTNFDCLSRVYRLLPKSSYSLHLWVMMPFLKCLVGGRRPFHVLSAGETAGPAFGTMRSPASSGGTQISRRKDQAGSLGIEEKVSSPVFFIISHQFRIYLSWKLGLGNRLLTCDICCTYWVRAPRIQDEER